MSTLQELRGICRRLVSDRDRASRLYGTTENAVLRLRLGEAREYLAMADRSLNQAITIAQMAASVNRKKARAKR